MTAATPPVDALRVARDADRAAREALDRGLTTGALTKQLAALAGAGDALVTEAHELELRKIAGGLTLDEARAIVQRGEEVALLRSQLTATAGLLEQDRPAAARRDRDIAAAADVRRFHELLADDGPDREAWGQALEPLLVLLDRFHARAVEAHEIRARLAVLGQEGRVDAVGDWPGRAPLGPIAANVRLPRFVGPLHAWPRAG